MKRFFLWSQDVYHHNHPLYNLLNTLIPTIYFPSFKEQIYRVFLSISKSVHTERAAELTGHDVPQLLSSALS